MSEKCEHTMLGDKRREHSHPVGPQVCLACGKTLKEIVDAAVAVTVERCAGYADNFLLAKKFPENQLEIRSVGQAIRALSPDPHYIEHERWKARLDEAKWWRYECQGILTPKGKLQANGRLGELEHKLAEMDKPESKE